MNDLAIIKRGFAEKKAAEYRSRGYEVWQDAELDFFPDLRADLLVRKGDETKVIAVQTRTELSVTPELAKLAEALSEKPGWTFDLQLVGEPERQDAPDDSSSFTMNQAMLRIANAEMLLDTGSSEAAFLLAWSAGEAALRASLAAAGFEIDRITHARYLLGHAVHQGVISENDDRYLSDMLAYRNAISHGFDVSGFDADRARAMITAATKLWVDLSSRSFQGTENDASADLFDPPGIPA